MLPASAPSITSKLAPSITSKLAPATVLSKLTDALPAPSEPVAISLPPVEPATRRGAHHVLNSQTGEREWPLFNVATGRVLRFVGAGGEQG